MSLAAVSNQSHYEDLSLPESVILTMTMGNPTSSGDESDEPELVIGECELTNETATLLANGDFTIRLALEIFTVTQGREWVNSEFIHWLRSVSPVFDDQITHGTRNPNHTGGSEDLVRRQRSVQQDIGQRRTNPGSDADDALVQPVGRRGRQILRRLLPSQEEELLIRMQPYVRPQQNTPSNNSEVQTQEEELTDSNDDESISNLAQPIGEQVSALTPSQQIQSHIPAPVVSESETQGGSTNDSVNGYLYLLENPSFPGWIKAGESRTDTRYESYNTADPHRAYRVIAEAPVHGILLNLERAMHNLISQRATARGVTTASGQLSEWFQISREAAIQCLRDLHPDTIVVHTIPEEE